MSTHESYNIFVIPARDFYETDRSRCFVESLLGFYGHRQSVEYTTISVRVTRRSLDLVCGQIRTFCKEKNPETQIVAGFDKKLPELREEKAKRLERLTEQDEHYISKIECEIKKDVSRISELESELTKRQSDVRESRAKVKRLQDDRKRTKRAA